MSLSITPPSRNSIPVISASSPNLSARGASPNLNTRGALHTDSFSQLHGTVQGGSATSTVGGTTPPQIVSSTPVKVPPFAQNLLPTSPRRSLSPRYMNGPSRFNGSFHSSFIGSQQQQLPEISTPSVDPQLQGLQAQVMACKEMSASAELAVKELAVLKERLARTEEALAEERDERQKLVAELNEERQERQNIDAHLTSQMQALMSELSIMMGRVDRLERPPEDPIKVAVQMIERRGHVHVNLEDGSVTLMQPLEFKPRTVREDPLAELKDVTLADAICYDLAELSKIFDCLMTIVGHTKGGENEFWQKLANNRARLIAEKVIQFGANRNLLTTTGLPGKRGKNEAVTEIYMDIHNSRGVRL